MSRDLPFDGEDAEVTDSSGDTAYRVANGVARVARAGAYVTGGALVASNGGGVPTQPGGQRLDSWHTGWSGNNDPDPDVPSPVVTFPDPAPYSTQAPTSRPALVAQEEGGHGLPLPGASVGDTAVDFRLGTPHEDTGAMFGTDDFPGAPSFLDVTPDYGTESTEAAWSPAAPEAGLPQWWGDAANPAPAPGLGLGLPETGNFLTNPTTDLFGLGRHPAVDENRIGELAETADDNPNPFGFGHTGYSPWAATQPVDGAHAAQMFDGMDDFGVYLGVDAHASLYTELEIDFGIGPQGAYLTTEMKVEASAGMTIKTAAGSNIGDQLDNLSNWLDSKSPSGAGRTGTDQHGIGAGGSGFGAAASGVPGGVAPVAPAAAGPSPFAAPPAPAPVAMTQPVAPAPAAPVIAAAPVVAATPLQTTIQPEAASSPIANVLAPPTGPSPLTAPAAAVPVLFDQQPVKPAPHPTLPKPVDTGTDTSPSNPAPLTKTPTTFGPGASTPSLGHTTPDSGTVSVPGSTPTKIPGADGKPTGNTDIDITTTKVPSPSITTRPAPQPSTPDDDATTPSTGGASTGAGGTQDTQPTHTRPTTGDSPGSEVPSVSVPSQPSATHSVPTHAPSQPSTVDVPTVDVPTVEIPTPDAPTYSAPNPAPVTPVKPPAAGNTKPIGDQWDPSHGYLAHPVAAPVTLDSGDHLVSAFGHGGLSSGLLPDGGGLYDVHSTHGTLDHTLI